MTTKKATGAHTRTRNAKRFSVRNERVCLECKVYANNAKDAVEMAKARSVLFHQPGTVATEITDGV